MAPPSLLRAALGLALASSLFALGCRDEPSSGSEGRSSQVPAKPTTSSAAGAAAAPASATAPATAAATAPATASAAAPAAATASASAAAPADPPLDCDTLLEPADIAAECGVLVGPPPDQPKDDIGAERTCSRRFSSNEAGALSVLVVRHESEAAAKERFKDVEGEPTEIKAISGIGDIARRFVKKAASGDPIYNVEAVKGRFSLVLFNSKVTVGGTTVGPVCDHEELEKLLARVVKRLP